MTSPHFDGQPRILDFYTPVVGTRSSRDLGWPCHAFRVTVPVRPHRPLNVFEETVLRLLDHARFDEKRLAEMTCLEGPLVRLLCGRLADLGLISERNDVTPFGRAYLAEATDEALEYEVRWVFRERLTGKLLPVVLGGVLRYEELVAWNRSHATIQKPTHRVEMRLIGPGHQSIQAPTVGDVAWATRRHQELHQQFAVLCHGVDPCPPLARKGQQMNIDPTPEAVFLRCAAIIPSAGGDYRVTDPFGYGFSDVLLRSHEALRERDDEEKTFIQRLRSSAEVVRQRPTHQNPDKAKAERVILARLGESVSDHRELFLALRQAELDFFRTSDKPRSSDEDAHVRYHAQQAAQHLTEALEIALAYVITRARRPACEAVLESGGRTPDQNRALLEAIARRLGLVVDGAGSLLRVAAGRVRALREGKRDLQALVAVSLAAADENLEHPVRTLAAQLPDWLDFLSQLKRMRDQGAHGQTRQASTKTLVMLRDVTYRTLPRLLPHLSDRGQEQVEPSTEAPAAASVTAMERVHDARRLATSRLEKEFGVRWYAGVGANMSEVLLQIELAADEWDQGKDEPPSTGGGDGPSEQDQRKDEPPIDVLRTVKDLASLMQELFFTRQLTGEVTALPLQPSAVAEQRAAQAGLLAAGASLPGPIARVSRRHLEQAMEGFNASLGAALLRLLLFAPLSSLASLADSAPSLLELSGRLSDLRGHGNKPVFLRPRDARALKSDVYEACKALMEI